MAAVLLALVGGSASPAAADSVHKVWLHDFSAMVVDEAHGRVFISQGRGTRRLVVTDLQGNRTAELNIVGAEAMVLAPDHASVYVASNATAAHQGQIVQISTADLSVRRFRIATIAVGDVDPAGGCPRGLAVLDGWVWFTDRCPPPQSGSWSDSQDVGSLRALDPRTGTVTGQLAPDWHLALRADPSTHRLYSGLDFAGPRSANGYALTAYDATAIPSPSVVQRWRVEVPSGGEGSGSMSDFRPILGTGELVLSEGQLIDGATGALDGWLSGGRMNPGALSVATRADGAIALGIGGDDGAWFPLETYLPISRLLQRSYVFNINQDAPPIHVTPFCFGSMSFGARKLYALQYVSGPPGPAYPSLFRVISPRPASALHVRMPVGPFHRGQVIRVKVRFSGPSLPGRKVHLQVTRMNLQTYARRESDVRIRLGPAGRGSVEVTITSDFTSLFAWVDDHTDTVAAPERPVIEVPR
ncbi:hypothetical protein GCM10028772_38840 [Nocardioides ultimimeridianus]